jgi:FlaG/FlaF family flagellin (archaellin)
MKKAWKARDEEGVSLLIAVILTVAITVSLAAVLFALSERENDYRHYNNAPVGSLSFNNMSSTSVKITFGTFSPNPNLMDIKIIITNNSDTSDRIELSFANPPDAGTINMVATGGASATYTDFYFQDSTINTGDYIIIDGLHPKTTYSVIVFHYPTESLCQLAGTTTFTLE